jgi:hypothetical protein
MLSASLITGMQVNHCSLWKTAPHRERLFSYSSFEYDNTVCGTTYS